MRSLCAEGHHATGNTTELISRSYYKRVEREKQKSKLFNSDSFGEASSSS